MKLFKGFCNLLASPANIRHQTLNWHQTEVAARHPSAPIGWIARDQGQLDLFSGRSRIILDSDGYLLLTGSSLGILADKINLKPSSISNFSIMGKSFNKEAFSGALFAKAKVSKEVINSQCYFALPGGGVIPFSDFFELLPVFEEAPALKNTQTERADCISNAMKGLPYSCF